jgi:hypothetical protein
MIHAMIALVPCVLRSQRGKNERYSFVVILTKKGSRVLNGSRQQTILSVAISLSLSFPTYTRTYKYIQELLKRNIAAVLCFLCRGTEGGYYLKPVCNRLSSLTFRSVLHRISRISRRRGARSVGRTSGREEG